jgi:hypothetical protein
VLEILSMLAAEDTTAKQKKEEINSRILTFFGGNCSVLHILGG